MDFPRSIGNMFRFTLTRRLFDRMPPGALLPKTLRVHVLLLLGILCLNPLAAFSQLTIGTYVDPYDIQYVRIKSVAGNQYLYQAKGNGSVQCLAGLDGRDLRSHWFITQVTNAPGQYWIRNRVTGDSMHVETQTGAVQVGAFAPVNWSQRWQFLAVTNDFRIQNLWQTNEYLSAPGAANGFVAYASLNPSLPGERFVIESLPAGATLPWYTYDQGNAIFTAPATVVSASNYDKSSVASEARSRSCIYLSGLGAAVQWGAVEAADSLNLRYSVPEGKIGTISLRITPAGTSNTCVIRVPVTSGQAWTYYNPSGTLADASAAGFLPMKRFNDVRVKLTNQVNVGDTIALACGVGDIPAYVDCLEAEKAQTVSLASTTPSLSVKTYGARGDGVSDDTAAFISCISAANNGSVKLVYVPAGRYNLGAELILPSNITLQGAGMWSAELIFIQSSTVPYAGQSLGGLTGNGSGIVVSDLYIKGAGNIRGDSYHGLKGYWGTGSLINNVWVEQADVGAWIGNYNQPGTPTLGLMIRGCRFRNTFADGVNFARGTSGSVIENCHVRGAGDDGLAAWSSYDDYLSSNAMDTNDIFRYNTVECGDRAAGIGIFGGQGHLLHHNVVSDQVNGAGIRFNTVFVTNGSTQIGYGFGTNVFMRVYQNTLRRIGGTDVYGDLNGAVNLQTFRGNVANISLSSNAVNGSLTSGLMFNDLLSGAFRFTNIYISGMSLQNVSQGISVSSTATGTAYTNSVRFSNVATPVANASTTFTLAPWSGVDSSLPGGTASQTIAPFAVVPTQVFTNGAKVTIIPPVATSGLPVTMTVKSGPATISGSTLTLTGVGTVVLAANQAGNASYLAAPEVTTSFVVKSSQTIAAFAPITGKTSKSAPFAVTVPKASSGLPVTLTVKSGPATISGTTVTLKGAGTVVLAANQAGNTSYAAAPELTVTFTAAP